MGEKMERLPQFDTKKRLERGNHRFVRCLAEKIFENNPAEMFTLPPHVLRERLMELSEELLNKNLSKANFWHSRTQEEDLAHAEELVTEIVNDIGSMDPDSAYNAYIDQIRTLTQQDQATNGDPYNKSHAEQGANILQQDLEIESHGQTYGMRQAGFEVHTSGAVVAPLPANPSRISQNAKAATTKRKKPG